MRVIIDSNALRGEFLREWLSFSRDHVAVVTDYAWMEIYKGNEWVALQESMKILRDFPNQVRMLKGTKTISGMSGRSPGYANAMLVPAKRANFRELVRTLERAERGEVSIDTSLRSHGVAAKEHFEKMDGLQNDFSAFLSAADAVYGNEAIRAFRDGSPLTMTMIERIIDATDHMYRGFLRRHPAKPRIDEGRARFNHFTWRYALAANLHAKQYISGGSNVPKKAGRVINDVVDNSFAVYGTFFNGVMTDDQGAMGRYLELAVILEKLGGRVPIHYLDHAVSLMDAK